MQMYSYTEEDIFMTTQKAIPFCIVILFDIIESVVAKLCTSLAQIELLGKKKSLLNPILVHSQRICLNQI